MARTLEGKMWERVAEVFADAHGTNCGLCLAAHRLGYILGRGSIALFAPEVGNVGARYNGHSSYFWPLPRDTENTSDSLYWHSKYEVQEGRDCRVLAACFLAAMADAGDLP